MVYTRKDSKGWVHDSFGSNLTATKKKVNTQNTSEENSKQHVLIFNQRNWISKTKNRIESKKYEKEETNLDFFKEAGGFCCVRSTCNSLIIHISNSESCIHYYPP